ncbi:MAG: phosphotransferase [Candidatus Bathyarchaeia archaeon]
MSQISIEALKQYLSDLFKGEVEIPRIGVLGGSLKQENVLKGYGYGLPLRIDFRLGGEDRSIVLNTIKPGGFGHERMADRASILLWQSESYNSLPRHVRSIDVGAFTKGGFIKTVRDCEEFFLITELVEGRGYYLDLERIKDTNRLLDLDLERCRALALYLSEIHSLKGRDKSLYERRIRELVGHNECIMGITDSYPSDAGYITPEDLAGIEKRCIDWRFRLKGMADRLSQVHGDFHPWNIIFREGLDFTVLDRSRGEWGEPADDVATMATNYLFYALQQKGSLEGVFKVLWDAFFETYLDSTRDSDLFRVVQPFFCWRSLVVASPVWYPNLSLDVRMKLLKFARNVLETIVFDPSRVFELLEE